MPEKPNSGASRGLVAHILLECLLNPRHRHYIDKLIKTDGNFTKYPAIYRLVLKNATKFNVADKDNLELIQEMIVTGLKYDFIPKNAKSVTSEKEFSIEGEDYIINGFIDKEVIFPDKSVEIWDYKTSKSKFQEHELKNNLQNYMYSLACYKLNKVIPQVKFLFLKFSRQPLQEAQKLTIKQLEKFENYLKSVAAYLKIFSRSHATSDLANKDIKRSWLCGKASFRGQEKADGSPMWCCSFKFGLEYYSILDKDGDVIKSAFTKEELKPTTTQKVMKMKYSGCPAFQKYQTNNKEI